MNLSDWLPVALQLVMLGLRWMGAKQDTLDVVGKLIESSHNEGLITGKTKDVFLEQKAQMELELEKQSPQLIADK